MGGKSAETNGKNCDAMTLPKASKDVNVTSKEIFLTERKEICALREDKVESIRKDFNDRDGEDACNYCIEKIDCPETCPECEIYISDGSTELELNRRSKIQYQCKIYMGKGLPNK
eukprot:15364478-Ditylum_brightwellii.AAC.1